jgi:hypothetical protein
MGHSSSMAEENLWRMRAHVEGHSGIQIIRLKCGTIAEESG